MDFTLFKALDNLSFALHQLMLVMYLKGKKNAR